MIPIVELIRLEENYTQGTFGVLRINKEVFCVTLEPAARQNVPFVSSIPAQQYICEKYGNTFQVMNVPERSHIIFHAGNALTDTRGCIILGEHFGKLRGDRAVLNSGNTLRKFIEKLKEFDKIHLTIQEVY
jgi:hypothetical protein